MAKQAVRNNNPAVEQLAAGLFEKLWSPNAAITAEYLAEQCLAAAIVFNEVIETSETRRVAVASDEPSSKGTE